MASGSVPAPGFRDKFGEVVDARRGAQFQILQTRELVNRLSARGMPFGWTANPYRGCEIGCAYCYARSTHEYLGQPGPEAFERVIYVKDPDPGRLRQRLRAARASGLEVAIGTATDPYQPAEGRFGITRAVLRALCEVGGVRVGITTKSAGIARDVDLLRAVADRCDLMVNISLISLDADLLRTLEPRAPRPDLRLDAMCALSRSGIPTRLFAMPVLPFITDAEAPLGDLVKAAARAGASEVVANVLFLREPIRAVFLGWLCRERPWLRTRYEELYRGGAYAPRDYRQGIEHLVQQLARREGVPGRSRAERVADEAPARARQMALVW
jgi:DNA repair photolyase